MTVELHLLRHAHAGDPAKWSGSDSERPLSAKGRDQAARLGSFLAAAGFEPDVILSSPKKRSVETAELVADALGKRVRIDDRLAAGSLLIEAVERILSDAGDPPRPMLVGHDPDFSELLAELVGAEGVPLRKGAIARVDVERPIAAGSGILRWLVPPDVLIPAR